MTETKLENSAPVVIHVNVDCLIGTASFLRIANLICHYFRTGILVKL